MIRCWTSLESGRRGPATGGATSVGQGNVRFARWGNPGGYPVIVLAPSSVAGCVTLTRAAFELAERFRSPVILLTDKELNLTLTSVESEIFSPRTECPLSLPSATARSFASSGRREAHLPHPVRGGGPVTSLPTTVTPLATFRNDTPYPFCPGRGHGPILDHLNRTLVASDVDPRQVVLVSDIGITVLVFNKMNFGMTGGQHSTTTPSGALTSTTPSGNLERPLEI